MSASKGSCYRPSQFEPVAVWGIDSGIKTIIIPEKNKNELSEIPKSVKRKIRFIPVSSIDEVIAVAIGDDLIQPAPKKSAARGKKSTNKTRAGTAK